MADTDRTEVRDEEESTEPIDTSVSENFVEGDAARDAYPTEVSAALVYAAENKYDYGPKLRDADLQWDVNGVEPMDGSVSRVFIDYSPSATFRGRVFRFGVSRRRCLR